ncbi:hypothetical protein [Halocatena halophila]|uniref:hypothetical protein n=1 Tax=Halocatena halophila TaxID=2814576 RepID=UPI002ED4ACF8
MEQENAYAVFATNRDVPLDRVQEITRQYTKRWQIENEYKTIKQHFLPTVASTDYRIQFLYFVIGVTMYSVWRVTNLLFRNAISVHLGEKPPIPAREFVETLTFCTIPVD